MYKMAAAIAAVFNGKREYMDDIRDEFADRVRTPTDPVKRAIKATEEEDRFAAFDRDLAIATAGGAWVLQGSTPPS